MKFSSVLAIGTFIIAAFGVGFLIQEWRYRDLMYHSTYPVDPVDVNVDVEVERNRTNQGFRYNGLLLDIDTNDGGSVNIGPQHYYRMGYSDGYYGYRQSPRYCDNYRYREGYEQGKYDRMERMPRW